MSIRRTLAIIVAAAIVLSLCLGTATGVALWTADAVVKRVQGANGHLEALHDLDGAAGRYGRQVMNQLLFGYERPGALQTARNDMQRILSALARATRAEFNVVSSPEELQGQLPELERVRRITDLYFAIDKAATQSFALAGRGDQEGAIDLANRQVNFPLSNEVQPLIERAIAEERSEIAEKTQDFDRLRNQVVLLAGLAGAAALLVIALAAFWASRQLGRQVHALTGRIAGSARGEATPGAAPMAGDFRPLGLALDAMAATLASERTKLASADAQLRILDTERSQFLADVGHQLRTPLTVLRGEADVALRAPANEKSMRESMERVRAQSAELGLLLEDLLEAVRQEADTAPTSPSPIELGDVVASAAGEGKVLAEPREVDIVVERAIGPIVIPGDFRRLKQALMIGIDNAVKHSPPGSTIHIGTASDERQATVHISDEGPGITEDDQPNLFRRFYRGRQENELSNTGFGIGLSIAKRIVEQHGGTVDLRNGPDGGALFEIALPRGDEPAR